jgi:hypothetical protein
MLAGVVYVKAFLFVLINKFWVCPVWFHDIKASTLHFLPPFIYFRNFLLEKPLVDKLVLNSD